MAANRFLVLLAAATLTAPVVADTVWVCGLSHEGVRLHCIAEDDPSLDAVADPRTATVSVRGTRFPLDTRRQWMVDLWTPPSDPAFVGLLARATICYRTPDCQVIMAPGPWLQVAER